MSIHIEAAKGDIAETVLLPGDPMRAKWAAETMLENPVCYNRVRGMYGYTGNYKGRRISIQGTGVGLPSLSIYANELISFYGSKKLIRIGSCGSIQSGLKLRDIILAIGASTDSAINKITFGGMDYAPCADFDLLNAAYKIAAKKEIDVKVGNVLSADRFYNDDPDFWKPWAKYGVLAVEMETSALYTIAAANNVGALSILTVSDSIVNGEATSQHEREQTFGRMVEIALEL